LYKSGTPSGEVMGT